MSLYDGGKSTALQVDRQNVAIPKIKPNSPKNFCENVVDYVVCDEDSIYDLSFHPFKPLLKHPDQLAQTRNAQVHALVLQEMPILLIYE